MDAIHTEQLTVSYGGNPIIKDLNIAIPKGKITVFIGSNGCGKSTLLRSLARLLKPTEGSVVIDGQLISKWPTKELAKKLAILPQGPIAPESLTVLNLVKQGRYPYQSWLNQWSKQDEEMVKTALAMTKLEDLADRPVDALSGGQRQRAWIAMILAQGSDTILLDEPTTYLDLAHQVDILDLLYDLNKREKRTIVMVLHDINLACRYAHHIVSVKNGRVYSQGTPEDTITAKLIEDVFGLESHVMTDPFFGTPLCIPSGKGRILPTAKEFVEKNLVKTY
ncbi:ABC transporter ATP-binding protein [Anaerobacillus alkaliphilus]|uniref:ABC transporter ATP-binding protein n=1 Tax=Anaerobacillus alkaliphilus TaxID=1548597 RepID=A0A4Q0VWP8_9BACI|nr:ABC transporter ATP-binding protein [Anaerobacillus alkaliphilus]RXJ02749.1 ABC transporter ATP-binding protein [Anaerobacillus alkaliphilus]